MEIHMNRNRKQLLALSVAAAIVSPSVALAQQGSPPARSAQPPMGPTSNTQGAGHAEQPAAAGRPLQHEQMPHATQMQDRSGERGMGGTTRAANPHALRANQLIGMDVHNSRGERLGDIEDVVIDLQSGQVRYAILSYGGFMGMGDKWFAYPTSAFRMNERTNQLMLNVPRERLNAAEGFDKDKWPATTDRSFWDQIEQAFSSDRRTPAQRQGNVQLVRASELMGKDVRDQRGQEVGEINDAVIDLVGQRVHYVVLELDRGWFQSDRMMPLPVSAISRAAGREELVLNRDREQLRNAPAFERNQWPNFSEANTRQRYDAYHRNNNARAGTSSGSTLSSAPGNSTEAGNNPGGAMAGSTGAPGATSGDTSAARPTDNGQGANTQNRAPSQ
jgi:sporulation protein YlmC with PRC-barrel domain